ncbi:nucleoredoxin [Tachysurus ichikawai]
MKLWNKYKVTSIPSLVFVDATTGKVVCRNGLLVVKDDPKEGKLSDTAAVSLRVRRPFSEQGLCVGLQRVDREHFSARLGIEQELLSGARPLGLMKLSSKRHLHKGTFREWSLLGLP